MSCSSNDSRSAHEASAAAAHRRPSARSAATGAGVPGAGVGAFTQVAGGVDAGDRKPSYRRPPTRRRSPSPSRVRLGTAARSRRRGGGGGGSPMLRGRRRVALTPTTRSAGWRRRCRWPAYHAAAIFSSFFDDRLRVDPISCL